MASLPLNGSSEVHFGSVGNPLPNWRENDSLKDETDPDDEEMEKTPPDVIAIIGFDPKEERT